MSPRPLLPRTFGGALVAGVMADYWTFDQNSARWHVVKDDSFWALTPWRAFSDQYEDAAIDRPFVLGASQDAVLAAIKAYAAVHSPLAMPTGVQPPDFGGTAVPPAPKVPSSPSTPSTTPLPSVDLAKLATDADRVRYADQLIRALHPEASAAQRQIIRAIGHFESNFGLVGKFAPQGAPSFNWGAITTTSGPYFIANDKDATGKVISQKFAKYATPGEGLNAFIRVWSRPADTAHKLAIDKASAAGSAEDVSALMFKAGYYVGTSGTPAERIAAYASAIFNTAKADAATLGEALAVQPPGKAAPAPGPSPSSPSSTASGSSGGLAAVGIVAALGALFMLGRGR